MPFILILICEYWWKYYVLLCSTNLRKLTAQQPDLGGHHSSLWPKATTFFKSQQGYSRPYGHHNSWWPGRGAREAPDTRHSVMHIFANKKLNYIVSSNYYMIFLNKGCGWLPFKC